ncbi:hypothetical protein SAMN04490247_1210 [Salimicrobium halophilum]|uniref:Uncharacterized protein n=2 Tax=Salimicrobium halophilum TaxID=86666 RepID=A0A1G8S200_9BACI|nr:hypothetical protein SAMN04490247_1210 [Salimicrobium halophilum]
MNLKDFVDQCTIMIRMLITEMGVAGHYNFFFKEGILFAEKVYICNPKPEMNKLREAMRTHFRKFINTELV